MEDERFDGNQRKWKNSTRRREAVCQLFFVLLFQKIVRNGIEYRRWECYGDTPRMKIGMLWISILFNDEEGC